MKILLTGCGGQLGAELAPFLAARGPLALADIEAPRHEVGEFHRLDLSDSGSVFQVLDQVQPSVIVNAAAYTAVDKAESEKDTAFRINGFAPGLMAQWARDQDAFLVHYSTDYVFDGMSRRPYRETDAPDPINVYGASKLAGEQAIQDSGCRHLILRTAWLYSSHGNNFLRTMMRLARDRSDLRIVSDQHGCPTWARNLARVTDRFLDESTGADAENAAELAAESGIFHYCDSTATSWYDFANLIFDLALELGLLKRRPGIEAVDSRQFQTEAARPRYSVLDTSAIRERLRFDPADLTESVRGCLEDMTIDE